MVIQIVYIGQFFAVDQMFNCILAYTPIIEGLCLVLSYNDYILDPKNISAYQRFIRSIQYFKCKTRFDILQTVANVS